MCWYWVPRAVGGDDAFKKRIYIERYYDYDKARGETRHDSFSMTKVVKECDVFYTKNGVSQNVLALTAWTRRRPRPAPNFSR